MKHFEVAIVLAILGCNHSSQLAAADHVPSLRVPTLLPCRHSTAACLWLPDGTEKEIVLREGRQMPDEWIQNDRGDGVALFRGHQNPGVLVGFRADGQVDATVDLENGAELPQVVGVTPAGDRVLCTFTTLDISCSVVLPSSPAGSRRNLPVFPSGCAFPRTLVSGELCIEEGPSGYEVRQGNLDGTLISRTHLTLPKAISDVQPVGEQALAILSNDQALFLLPRSDKLAQIKSDTVLWMAPFGEALAYASCRIDEDRVRNCAVFQLDEDQRSKELWRSETLVPVSGHRVGTVLIIDATSPNLDHREVIVLDRRYPGRAGRLWTSH